MTGVSLAVDDLLRDKAKESFEFFLEDADDRILRARVRYLWHEKETPLWQWVDLLNQKVEGGHRPCLSDHACAVALDELTALLVAGGDDQPEFLVYIAKERLKREDGVGAFLSFDRIVRHTDIVDRICSWGHAKIAIEMVPSCMGKIVGEVLANACAGWREGGSVWAHIDWALAKWKLERDVLSGLDVREWCKMDYDELVYPVDRDIGAVLAAVFPYDKMTPDMWMETLDANPKIAFALLPHAPVEVLRELPNEIVARAMARGNERARSLLFGKLHQRQGQASGTARTTQGP